MKGSLIRIHDRAPRVPRVDWKRASDDDLIESLETLEDRVPLAAAREIVRRIDRLGPILARLCDDPRAWQQLDAGRWAPLHALLLLGESGSDRFAAEMARGACRYLQSEMRWHDWLSIETVMAGYPEAFLVELGREIRRVRAGRGTASSAVMPMGRALLRRHKKSDALARELWSIRNEPEIDARTRDEAFHFLIAADDTQYFEHFLGYPAPAFADDPGMWRRHLEAQRANARRVGDVDVSRFEFYRASERRSRTESLAEMRRDRALEIECDLTHDLDDHGRATLGRFASFLRSTPARPRASCLLVARWFLVHEAGHVETVDWPDISVHWFLERLVYRRRLVERGGHADLWTAALAFFCFLAEDRQHQERWPAWGIRIAHLAGLYGKRAGL